MLNGRELRRKFIEFNAQYFGNKLPPYAIRVVKRVNWLDLRGQCNRERRLIRMRQGLADQETIEILVHEMIHARTTDRHGAAWKREMIRLREAGAPLPPADADFSPDEWHEVRVTKEMFERRVDNILCAPSSLKLTLSDVIEDFIRGYGGARTVAEFKRKHPWAGAVFREAKQEFAEYLKLEVDHAKLMAQGGGAAAGRDGWQ